MCAALTGCVITRLTFSVFASLSVSVSAALAISVSAAFAVGVSAALAISVSATFAVAVPATFAVAVPATLTVAIAAVVSTVRGAICMVLLDSSDGLGVAAGHRNDHTIVRVLNAEIDPLVMSCVLGVLEARSSRVLEVLNGFAVIRRFCYANAVIQVFNSYDNGFPIGCREGAL